MPSIIERVKLGARPTTYDPRMVQYRTFAPSTWTTPKSYSWDAEHGNVIPPRMYLNDTLGCCVMATRANHTTRFQYEETGKVLTISDAEVRNEYLAETGGVDSGLIPLESLKAWRKGWISGGEVHLLHAWAQVNQRDPQQIQEATIVGTGMEFSVALPISAAHQMDAGKPWDLVTGPDGIAASWGRHQIYAETYDERGVTCWTWAKRQLMTYRWIAEYCEFAALTIDAIDRAHASIDREALTDAIVAVT